MRRSLRNLFWAALLASGPSLACSCYGPHTFCGVLYPPFPNPEWWLPDAIILGVKVGDIAHGLDVKVVTVFSGTAQAGDTLRVWGDTGLLCRVYPDAWAVGDTVIWALHWTDFAGGPLEQDGDYLISVCGTYWLDYSNGVVSGPLLEEEVIESVPIDHFAGFVDGCLALGVGDNDDADALVVRAAADGPWLSMRTDQRVHLTITDAMGRSCIARDWDGSPMQLSGMAAGVYMLQVQAGARRFGAKVMVE